MKIRLPLRPLASFFLLFFALFSAPLPLRAQTVVFQTSYTPDTETTGVYNRTTSADNGIRTAVQFSTGATSYTLDSVSVLVRAANPTGALASTFLAIYSDATDTPDTLLQTLTNPASLANYPSNAADAIYTSPTSFTLAANTTYWLVYEPLNTGADASVLWAMDQSTHPVLGLTAFASATGGTAAWTSWSVNSNPLPSLTIYGSAIPEPSTYALFGGLAALAFVIYRRRTA